VPLIGAGNDQNHMTIPRNERAASIESGSTVFVTASGRGWQIVSRFGVKGEYDSRKEAVGEALRLATEQGARQVLAQSNVGKYKRVWPRFSSVHGEAGATGLGANS